MLIPDKMKGQFANKMFGCDICQDVCPWNRFQNSTDETRFEPRSENVSADLNKILSLTPENYAEKFRRSAMKRAKLGGLKRNAQALKNGKK
jgi:epoxyqueuosine reductase